MQIITELSSGKKKVKICDCLSEAISTTEGHFKQLDLVQATPMRSDPEYLLY